ncbi:hypothetical protein R5R35_004647 [Gryllus longicercus]|uniref:OSK domain-containing protein n=1 Tax=Gryllus longicercus TaxID=2509291 RepID=A0AAN9W0V7_9ORTH
MKAERARERCEGVDTRSLARTPLAPFNSSTCQDGDTKKQRGQDRRISHALYSQNPYSDRFPGVLTPNSLRSLHLSHVKQLLRNNHEVEPVFYGFQLVGDSLLLRFAEQMLRRECKNEASPRRLGLCVSGQTVEQLRRRLQSQAAALGNKVVLLVGTNDLLQGRDIEKMKFSFDQLVDILEETVQRLIILTLPPIPKLEDDRRFRMKFKQFNDFLKLFPRKYANIICIDMTRSFQTNDNHSNINYFERWYDILQSRPDLVHLNHAGLNLLRDKLLSSCCSDSD